MRKVTHEADLCVIGGGLAGMCAAIAAARHGARVVLMQDRPVLGGNASSEIRMWICGAHQENNRETGIIEELQLENLARNPAPSYAMWDAVLYTAVAYQPNLTLLLNCSCRAAVTDAGRVREVTGWQLTTETEHTVRAALFSDCSGDSVLAAMAGADFRIGREAAGEHNEDIEPPVADKRTMGQSCLLQPRETPRPQPYAPPAWANYYASPEDLPYRTLHVGGGNNFWWIELGGEYDSIHDTEMLRHELLKVAYGVWDLVKNRGPQKDELANWALDWVGFLPGKRESRRCLGDHILTQNDVRAEGRFDDVIAYGGWSMDDHHPGGVATREKPTIFHPAPAPFGVPYRSLYSRNLDNLFFAGRNISATHAAMSSTRVMATCATMGQAVGTAAALALRHGLSPRGVYQERLGELQQLLMDDDCYLPHHARAVPERSRTAKLTATEGDPEPLRNGVDRPREGRDNGWTGSVGASVTYAFASPAPLRQARLILDSDLNRQTKNMPCSFLLNVENRTAPATLVKDFRLEAQAPSGEWSEVARVTDNTQRLVRVPLDVTARAIRFVPESTRGSEKAHVFAFDVR